ncbi:5138_t:CDS:2, partial [Dentiscutata heterogama]
NILNMVQSQELDKWIDNNFFEKNHVRFPSRNSFEKCKINGALLSANSCKLYLIKCNKFVVLNKFTFSQQYRLEDFINELKQYHEVELHQNILKFIAIIEKKANEFIFIHEYACDGTLRQYLKQNSSKFNWNEKLNIAKQIVSAYRQLIMMLKLVFFFFNNLEF